MNASSCAHGKVMQIIRHLKRTWMGHLTYFNIQGQVCTGKSLIDGITDHHEQSSDQPRVFYNHEQSYMARIVCSNRQV